MNSIDKATELLGKAIQELDKLKNQPESKTVRERIEGIPNKKMREKLLGYAEKYPLISPAVDINETVVENIYEAIRSLFSWDRSPEGYKYWLDIYTDAGNSRAEFDKLCNAPDEPKFKVGDKVRIIDKIYGHEFDIGEVVEIEEDVENKCYKANNKKWWWHIYDEEIEIVEEEKEPVCFDGWRTWKPEPGEKYCFIASFGEVQWDIKHKEDFHLHPYKTEELAKRELARQLLIREMWEFEGAREFVQGKHNWYLLYDYSIEKWSDDVLSINHKYQFELPFFNDVEQVQKFLKHFENRLYLINRTEK